MGSGIPVVALHGSAANARQWSALSEDLDDGIRLIAPDMPGYGSSAAWWRNGSGRLQATADRVSALLETCRRPVHLVGHSAGGLAALNIARERPDLIASLTLIEPVAFHLLAAPCQPDRTLYREIECLAGIMAAALADDDPAAGMARFIDFWTGEGAWAALPPDRRLRLSAHCSQVVCEFAACFAETWPVESLQHLAAPVQLIMGLRSPVAALRVTEILAESIARSTLRMIPDAGHLAPLTHSDLVNTMIGQHIRRAEPSAAVAQASPATAA